MTPAWLVLRRPGGSWPSAIAVATGQPDLLGLLAPTQILPKLMAAVSTSAS
jgi:hypothetical protein